jgi:hypothetical protein
LYLYVRLFFYYHVHTQSPRLGLFGVTIRQALFIAPCSHTFHYKCIRPLLESHHPGFSCPLCRTFADLEEDVEVEHEADMDIDVESPVGSDEHGHGGDEDSGMEDGANQHQHQHQQHLGVSREAGAETEVEEAGAGRPRRVLRNGNSPVEDEGQADEEMVDLNVLAEEEAAAAVLDDDGGDDMGVRVVMDEDIDGTVGGKRKR